nr:MAG TPA: hypothetical protein [Caudoviricetes sp.]
MDEFTPRWSGCFLIFFHYEKKFAIIKLRTELYIFLCTT